MKLGISHGADDSQPPIVFFRIEDGTPVALEGRCIHRHLPLSMGKMAARGGFRFEAGQEFGSSLEGWKTILSYALRRCKSRMFAPITQIIGEIVLHDRRKIEFLPSLLAQPILRHVKRAGRYFFLKYRVSGGA
jgi:hypothetical protein